MLEINKIYNMDCFLGMKEIKDQSIDLILSDLPYGVTNNKRDKILPLDKLWEEYERIIKDNGCILLFAQGKFYNDLINSNRKLFRYDLIWDKVLTTGFLNANRQPLRRHEQIAVFYKHQPKYNPQFEKGQPLHGKGKKYLHKPFINNNYGDFKIENDFRKGSTEKYPTSILKFQKTHPSRTRHPTEKPVELLKYLILTYSNEEDLILDNCIGSGSTAIASIKTNRNFIGFEIDKGFYEIAKQRINQEINECKGGDKNVRKLGSWKPTKCVGHLE